jgi:15-cis-phytoene synthase
MTDEEIFKKGSTTYYWSSRFFSPSVRDDVLKLYSFVRVVDDYVDQKRPDVINFEHICRLWESSKKTLGNPERTISQSVNERVVRNICYVVHRYECDPTLVDSFLDSMKKDLQKSLYISIDDTLEYVYGSAEVIGLLMARILKLPKEADVYASLQGRAMQFINFIRDISEDNDLGRCYIPKEDLVMFGLKDVSKREAERKPREFTELIEYQLSRYMGWQKEAAKGFRYIPYRERSALRAAVDMYNWTANEIQKDPLKIYSQKIKPSRLRVLSGGIKRVLHA